MAKRKRSSLDKKFGGKHYSFHNVFNTRTAAASVADKFRSAGYSARVFRVKDYVRAGYDVYEVWYRKLVKH